MDLSTPLSVVHTLFAALNCSELKEVCSMWNYESKLDEFIEVVVTVKNVLLDAEAKYIYDQLPRVIQQYIEELSLALYDADDLIDEFVTLAKQRHLLHLQEDEFSQKVRHFFSHNGPLSVAGRMSEEIEKIEKKLDLLEATRGKFGLKGLKRDETCSYPDTEIIGRDDDVEEIVDKLLHSDVSSLTIVGMGGIGKTALVQLVFHYEKIKTEFSPRCWTCVSDHDQSNLDVKAILSQILESAGQKPNECSMEVVVNRVRELLLGNRFLIVVDDLWTTSRNELQKLLGHLVGGDVGSRIVVTTRSEETANIMGKSCVKYMLQGLSKIDSWNLFKQVAFDMIEHESPNDSYVDKFKIGKDIIKTCVNVPLAIRVLGGLLYGQDKNEWLKVQKFGLANLRDGENRITPVLKFSYHNLESQLKSCFSYCSLYPKDYWTDKKILIRLRIAQGYVVSCGNAQTVEDVGEEYFSVLLRKCFFQDVEKDRRGQTGTFKLHDLMHDVALEVSNKEICPTSYFSKDMDKAVRHVSLTKEQNANFDLINAHIRTILRIEWEIHPSQTFKPLNLSESELEVLPNSITKLYNLQTLDLSFCLRLKELPKNFSNLVNLRDLRLVYCYELTLMPFIITWMSKLIYLELEIFKVGVIDSSLKQQLEGLKALKMLRGRIRIKIHRPSSSYVLAITDGGYLRDMEHLDSIIFEFKQEERNEGRSDYHEELLGALQPHENLKDLTLHGYISETMPRSWAIEHNPTSVLPNLVQLTLLGCSELKCLPFLGNLQNLKELRLTDLPKLETVSKHSKASGERLQFFPCLQKLTLHYLPKCKGWGELGEIGDISQSHESPLFFFKLINLDIRRCYNLTSLPGCANVKTLTLRYFNERLQITSNPMSCLKLNEVTILGHHSMSWLDSLMPIKSLQSLTKLKIKLDREVENLGDFRRVFQECSSSLRELKISGYGKLRNISGGLRCLTALKRLHLCDLTISNLGVEEIEGDVECDGMPWGALSRTLQYLEIKDCPELKTFPKWMRKLTSLQQLYVDGCSKELYERCQIQTGKTGLTFNSSLAFLFGWRNDTGWAANDLEIVKLCQEFSS